MIATTIEQSEWLLDAGIDPNSADMCWSNVTVGDRVATILFVGDAAPYSIPAWSLSALITLCPEHVPYRLIRMRGKDIEGIFEDLVEFLCRKK